MGDFKRDLSKELQQDAPFTAAHKERILHSKRKLKRKSWPVPVAVVAIVTVLLFFALAKPESTPYTVASMPTDYQELLVLLKENEVPLTLQKATDNQQIISAEQQDLHGRLPIIFSHFPLIVEEKKKYTIGDYVMLQEQGKYSAVQIVGVAGDVVETRKQQVYVNDQPLALPGMMALDFNKVHYEDLTDQELALGYYVEDASFYPNHPFTTRTLTVQHKEVVVKLNKQIELKKTATIVGQIVGIQEIKPTLILTEQEQALYEGLQEQGLEVLVEAEPLTVAKLYVQTMLEQDFDLNYDLTSQNEKYWPQTREEHVQGFTSTSFSKEEFQQMLAYLYNGLEDGVVSEYVSGEVQIMYQSSWDNQTVFKLMKNEAGIWQVGEITSQ